ncbi:MAG: hypothetical protein AAGD10_14230 [Myxococcota bacterium]
MWGRLLRPAGLVAGALSLASFARAAESVRALEGVTSDRKLPEFRLSVGFEQHWEKADISREFVQNAPDGTFDEVRELRYEAIRRELVVQARVGLVQRLEFRLRAPIVLQADSEIRFAEGVEGSSTVFGSTNADDPAFANRFPITTVPQERSRAGFGDLGAGLFWSVTEDRPDRAFPTLTLGLNVTFPTGDPWDPADVQALPDIEGSGGVGSGQTTFDLSLALSKRSAWGAPAFDPYFELGVELPLANAELEDLGYEPPLVGRVRAGSEVVIAEDERKGSYYGLDFGLAFRFIGSGRTRSQLSDYLPDFDQTRLDDGFAGRADFANPANYARFQDGLDVSCLSDPVTGEPLLPGVPCGEFTRVDEHFQMDGHIGFRIQPLRVFSFSAVATLGFQNDHFITGDSPGEDTDPAVVPNDVCGSTPCTGRINSRNSRGQDERSRFHDPRYDAVGGRFIAKGILRVGFMATAVLRF